MRVFPQEVLNLKTLQILDLSRNKIDLLPTTITSLTNLTHLDLSRNPLRNLPPEIGSLTSLVSLCCLSNKLNHRSLPIKELVSLRALKLLDLQFNPKCTGDVARKTVSPLLEKKVEVLITMKTKKGLEIENNGIVGAHACDRDATLLRSQLEPYSTPFLRTRLEEEFKVVTDPEKDRRDEVMKLLLESYERNGPRNVRRVQNGAPVSANLCAALLAELQDWAERTTTTRERPTVKATKYMILRSPAEFTKKDGAKAALAAAKVKKNQKLWDLAAAAVDSIDPNFYAKYTAVAFTYNFTGSPHIDTQNIGPFYGLAVGDYQGGELCVESGVNEVAMCDTKGKMVMVDGRFPHWVAPFTGNRYSVIFYQTEGDVTEKTTAVFI